MGQPASAKGKSKLTTVDKPKIVSGKVFNKELWQHVNLDTMGKYSAPSGLLKGAFQSMVGNKANKFGGRRTN